MSMAGYWPSAWPAEDAGPVRQQSPHGRAGFGLASGGSLTATSRLSIASTMVVLRDPGEAYLLCHTGGDGAISWVERFDPVSLEVIERSPDLPGGPPWPGGLAVHANGDLYVVFGCHVHRLAPDTSLVASAKLPRNRPYNSFVVLDDGTLITKDFGGALAPGVTDVDEAQPAELLAIDPRTLEVLDRLDLPEPSVARLSAKGSTTYVVGDTQLHRVQWDGSRLRRDDDFDATYRTLDGQTFGWDAVIADDFAWFIDDGAGAEGYAGSLRGCGRSDVPQHLVRVDLRSGDVALTEVSGLPGGIVANPPAVDPGRRIVVSYDSGNGVVAAFRYDDAGDTSPLWRADLDHGSHPIVFRDTGEVLLTDHREAGEDLVVLDIETGTELGRVATGSPVQSVLFPSVGFDRDVYVTSFTTVTRVHVA